VTWRAPQDGRCCSFYGLHPDAPRARRSCMGGAFLASLRAHQVIGVDTHRIRVVTRTSARLGM
jgi:hypothetical protein